MRFVHVGGAAVAAAVLTAGLAGAAAVRAEETEEAVAIADLPQAVTDAIKKDYPDAEFLAAEKETEDGTTTYEVEIKDGGKTLEVEVTPDGKIVEVEEEGADDGEDD